MPKEITIEEIRRQAEKEWTPCHHCDETDEQMWINGFITGYLNGQEDITIIRKPKLAYGVYNDIKDKDTLKNN